ncbi:MAG TPA: 4-(cytidine 5'-diphospho)-2-C-methyl-D-erythritol kinase, partial [Bacteroidia bacterium]|nr:4-(cytidine 5'-diphospho)-2-C-methyl-D-erythritol kinase [Bacteroidia bacterium]
MVVFPNAKINIGLQVLARRPDGYHDICSVLYPIGWKDALEVELQQEKVGTRFTASGIPIPGEDYTNICLKAVELVKCDYPLPDLRIHLHKHVPVGAGLGGGSSDGAAMIRLLNARFELGLSWGEMHHYARQLGSDCSFFIGNKSAIVSGRGDQMESLNLNLKGYFLVVVYPPVHISTAEAYSLVTPAPAAADLEEIVLNQPPEFWKEYVKNDFEIPVMERYPVIANIKRKL